MATAMMMDRTAMGSMGIPLPGSMPGMMPSMVMVPRCTMKFEKMPIGMKMTCTCDDPTACTIMQNLCTMMAGGMCTMCCMMNGIMVCSCNMTMGACKVEMMKDGCCVLCTSGDKMCCDMIHACCDMMTNCMKAGCTCCLMMGGTPVCCCF